MRDLLNLIRWWLLGLVRSRRSLKAENLALRHQLNVLRRSAPKRAALSNFDRPIFVCLYRIAPRILDAITIFEPETVIRWHQAGFRSFWRWKSRRRAVLGFSSRVLKDSVEQHRRYDRPVAST